MLKAGQECPNKITAPPKDVARLRIDLIQEELDELDDAIGVDAVETADAIADLLVVVLGTAVACGIEIEPVFNEVMRSNMTKFIDGHNAPNGKWIKGKSYSPANIKPILDNQISCPNIPHNK